MKKFENKEGMIIIKDYDTALEVLKSSNFIVPNLLDFIDRLIEATGRDLSILRQFIYSSPFFLEGERHAYLRKIGSKFLGPENYESWSTFFQSHVDSILDNLQKFQEFDLVKDIGIPIFTELFRPYLGVYPIDEKQFDEKAIVLQKLIEPMLSINKLQQVNNDLSELMLNLSLETTDKATPSSLLEQLVKGEFELTLDEKKAFSIVLYAATAPLAQTIVNILVRVYEDQMSSEEFLKNIDKYILESAAPVYIHRVALENIIVNETSITKGNTVLIEIASAFKETKNFAFGSGKHFCLGAFISQKLICEIIPKFISKYPNLQILSKQKDETNHIAHAYSSVRVRQN